MAEHLAPGAGARRAPGPSRIGERPRPAAGAISAPLKATFLIAAILAAAHGLGCTAARPHEYVLNAAHGSGQAARRFVLVPLNLVVRTPQEVEAAVARVEDEIERYLESRGKSVLSLPLLDARERWEEGMQQLDPAVGDGFAAAAGIFARSLETLGPFDAVILPSLVLRSANVRGGKVRWDGIARKEQQGGRRPVGYSDSRATLDMINQLSVSAASLHVFVISPSGEILFESYGGLDVLSKVIWEHSGRYRRELLEDPLIDRAHLREGIAIAFDPYLPRRP